ncbi:uncharacterized protein [Macrobrachium rosenbergii]|uniref:uncharacterized protein n=1 Tax=Macrobrachium rosenbergii TaxID=79674 RepID=UPI0034D6E3C8
MLRATGEVYSHGKEVVGGRRGRPFGCVIYRRDLRDIVRQLPSPGWVFWNDLGSGNMNAFRVLNLLAAVAAVYSTGDPVPILTTNVVHGHDYNPVGIHKVPVDHIHHESVVPFAHAAPVTVTHHAAVPELTVKHLGSPAVSVSHPVAVSHHAVAPVVVSQHKHVPAVSVSHGPVTHVKSGVYSAPVKSQYHSQDELGQYAFGYDAGTSSRDESRDAYGNVRGSFSYVDPYGKVQTQKYVADKLGFRVEGTNLPVHVTDGSHYRYRRSYATFPASTGPLTTIDHVGPIIHSHAPVVHKVSHVVHEPVHVVHKVAPVVHKVAPVVHKVAPVVHKVAPVVHEVVPFVHKVAPVVHKVAPIYGGAPAAPFLHGGAAPLAFGHGDILPYGFPYAESAYGSY